MEGGGKVHSIHLVKVHVDDLLKLQEAPLAGLH